MKNNSNATSTPGIYFHAGDWATVDRRYGGWHYRDLGLFGRDDAEF